MRTREGNSPDWVQIGEAYRSEALSIRALAKRYGVSDTAVRKEAKKRDWARAIANQQRREPEREPVCEPKSVAQAQSIAAASAKDLMARGRSIILSLMDEMEFLNRNHLVIASMVEDYVNGEKDSGARAKLLKVLDHEARSKTANCLATALAKLNYAAPGKKEQAADDAKSAGQGSGWGNDLDPGMAGRSN